MQNSIRPSGDSRDRDRLVSVREATAELQISYPLLLNAVRSGLLPSYAALGQRRLVLVAELAEHIQAHRVGPVLPQVDASNTGLTANHRQLDLFVRPAVPGGLR